MTSTLGTDQPFTGFIMDDFESDELTLRVPSEAGLQLPHLDVDTQSLALPTHAAVGLLPRTALEPAHGLSANEPGPALQVKRNRNALRAQDDGNFLHAGTGPVPVVEAAPPTRRALREARAAAQSAAAPSPATAEPLRITPPAAELLPAATAPVHTDPEEEAGLALAADLEAALNAATAPVHADSEEESSIALAADLEAALNAALEGTADPAEPVEKQPSIRQQRLAKAEAVSNGEPVEHLPSVAPASASAPSAGSAYKAMLESYGDFPALRPPARDFRLPLVLSVFLGFLGADRFYAGKHVTGALKLVTGGGLGIWWIVDIISVLAGRAGDKGKARYIAKKQHRAVAWALTATLFAGLIAAGAVALTPVVAGTAASVKGTLQPQPAPAPEWAVLAEAAGTTEPVIFEVTTESLRLTHDFPQPVYAYLQKETDAAAPAETVLLQDAPSQGQQNMAVTPGRYRLVVRTEGTDWTLKAEEMRAAG